MRADNLPFWLGDGLKVGDYPRSLVKRPKIHTRQTYQKGQVYFGTFRSVSGSARDGAAAGLESEKKYRVWCARFCPSHEHYREGLAIRVPTLAFEPFGTIITVGMRTTLRLIKRRKRMGLFDMFKKKAEPAAAAAPASISASAGADVLCSPVKGKVIKMADVPDPVFGGEVLGKGCAVWPEDDLVYAPCDGKVTVTMGHAVGLQSDSGIEVLVHVGVDTVNMNGDGFEGFVKADDVVKAGQPILKIDRAKIAAAGYKDCVVVAVSNTAEFADVELAVEADSAVAAGDAIVKVVRK